jgi:NADPH-dependent 2,4-dienoyl-CoA reductase/sulfur reductase-like enzyme
MIRAHSTDILVIGAGPAGIAAACAAAESGRRVTVVDDNVDPGGQIWRGAPAGRSPAAAWIARLGRTTARQLHQTTIIAAPGPAVLLAEEPSGLVELRYERLILATGARERFLPFPGWTSPRVMGAGGLQAMVKCGMPIAGKSVVVAGSGPLLLAVAAALRKQGARILFIAEQAPPARVMSFARRLLLDWGKLRQALGLKTQLLGIPYRTGCWPLAVSDHGFALRVQLQTPRGIRELDCDYIACGFFLVPNLELATLLRCQHDATGVTVDEWQQTSVPGVYAAGEAIGVGGLDKSLVEGEVAGYAAADDRPSARRLFSARSRSLRFAVALRATFALREELKHLAGPETLVCRCEDVSFAPLAAHATMRDAKLQTRCGMGPCQGRICGAACEFLFGWRDTSIRPPIFPTSVENLGATCLERSTPEEL